MNVEPNPKHIGGLPGCNPESRPASPGSAAAPESLRSAIQLADAGVGLSQSGGPWQPGTARNRRCG